MPDNTIVIVAARRTPVGAFQGNFDGVPATELGSSVIRAILADVGLDGKDVDEVVMGCVLPAGLGQAPARQAALGAGLPASAACTTLNKVCGSAMKSIILGHDMIRAGSAAIVVAGGMESMTNAPYLLPQARRGYRMGHGRILDHMIYDGLENPYDHQLMGLFGETCAREFGFTREQQDAYAAESVRRALTALKTGAFADEIVPVTLRTRKGEKTIDTDEPPGRCNIEKIPALKPAFQKDGTITAANSSSISDGAAAVVLMTLAEAERRGIKPLACIVGHAGFAQEPEWFTTAPAKAIRRLREKIGWTDEDVDLYEINEAFAVVAMAAMAELGITHDKLNVNGGACALGHPIGATGARITVALLHAMMKRGLKHGISALCIGGGEATALALEVI